MTTTDWIQTGALLIALITLIIAQWQQRKDFNRTERRIANKLKVMFLCQNVASTEEEIISRFKDMSPNEKVDDVEIRKTIYEMLVDQTLHYRPDRKFKSCIKEDVQ